MSKGQPNYYYYEPYSDMLTGKFVADWAKKLKLSCTGDWIVGKDFIATFKSWADSYYLGTKLIIWDESSDKYFELKLHLEEYSHTMFTDKTKEEFIAEVNPSLTK